MSRWLRWEKSSAERQVRQGHLVRKSVGHVKEIKFVLIAMESHIKGFDNESHILGT